MFWLILSFLSNVAISNFFTQQKILWLYYIVGGWWYKASCLRIIFGGSFLGLFPVWSRKIFFFNFFCFNHMNWNSGPLCHVLPLMSQIYRQNSGRKIWYLTRGIVSGLKSPLSLRPWEAWRMSWGRNRITFPFLRLILKYFFLGSVRDRTKCWTDFCLIHYSLFSPLDSADYCLTVSKIFILGVMIWCESLYVPIFDNVQF